MSNFKDFQVTNNKIFNKERNRIMTMKEIFECLTTEGTYRFSDDFKITTEFDSSNIFNNLHCLYKDEENFIKFSILEKRIFVHDFCYSDYDELNQLIDKLKIIAEITCAKTIEADVTNADFLFLGFVESEDTMKLNFVDDGFDDEPGIFDFIEAKNSYLKT